MWVEDIATKAASQRSPRKQFWLVQGPDKRDYKSQLQVEANIRQIYRQTIFCNWTTQKIS